MSAFKESLIDVLEGIRDELREIRESQARLEAAVVESAATAEGLRTSVMDQGARHQEALVRHQRRLTEHDVRLRNIEEGLPGGAAE